MLVRRALSVGAAFPQSTTTPMFRISHPSARILASPDYILPYTVQAVPWPLSARNSACGATHIRTRRRHTYSRLMEDTSPLTSHPNCYSQPAGVGQGQAKSIALMSDADTFP